MSRDSSVYQVNGERQVIEERYFKQAKTEKFLEREFPGKWALRVSERTVHRSRLKHDG